MLKTEMIRINNIFDLKYKKGELFENKYLKIISNNIYINDDFAELVLGERFNVFKNLDNNFHNINKSIVITHNGFSSCQLNIYFYLLHKAYYKDNKYRWLICGSSGDFGFNGLERTQKELLGVNTKRKVIRHFVEMYLKSKLARKEKLMSLIDDI